MNIIKTNIAKSHANTNISRPEPTETVDRSAYDAYEEAWDNYTQEARELQNGAGLRSTAVGLSTIAGLSTAGYFLGSMTGTGGSVAGAVIGAGAGLTTGAISGLYLGKDKGFEALGYMFLGGAGAAALAGYGGWMLGAGSTPIVGAVAGGLAGIAAGYGLSQKLEKVMLQNIKDKHGI